MAKVLITEDYLSDIGDAIRGKLGGSTQYTPGQMASAINSIPTVNPTLVSKSIVANGTYNASSDEADGYDSVSVNVPNTYSAQDEGKVVSSGALVAQGSQNVSQNGTYDTTLKNEVVVNVPNSYSAGDEGKVVSSGALVSQTSATKTENGTYDTTLNDEIVVAVPAPVIVQKTITENGTYNPASDNADGYSSVVVNVSGGGGRDIYVMKSNPIMTSNNTPSGIVSASSSLGGLFSPYMAFNGVPAKNTMQQGWLAAGSDNTPWIQYEFDEEIILYAVFIYTANNSTTVTRDVTIEGRKNGVWENALGNGNTVTLTFEQNTYEATTIEHKIPLNKKSYDAIRITGNQPFYMGANQSACTFSEIDIYSPTEL